MPRQQQRRSRHRHAAPASHRSIRTLEAALEQVALVLTEPLGNEHACLLVDAEYRPSTCVSMEASASADDVLLLVETVAGIAVECGAAHAIVVSSRPGGGFQPDDVNRWFALDHLATHQSFSLLEWFVCSDGLRVAVSAVAGEPSRWPGEPAR